MDYLKICKEKKMNNKKIIKYFSGVSLFLTIGTMLAAIFYNKAFVPSSMLMLALFLFSICYYIKEDNKKLLYFLFIVGVFLVIASLVYTYLCLEII